MARPNRARRNRTRRNRTRRKSLTRRNRANRERRPRGCSGYGRVTRRLGLLVRRRGRLTEVTQQPIGGGLGVRATGRSRRGLATETHLPSPLLTGLTGPERTLACRARSLRQWLICWTMTVRAAQSQPIGPSSYGPERTVAAGSLCLTVNLRRFRRTWPSTPSPLGLAGNRSVQERSVQERTVENRRKPSRTGGDCPVHADPSCRAEPRTGSEDATHDLLAHRCRIGHIGQ